MTQPQESQQTFMRRIKEKYYGTSLEDFSAEEIGIDVGNIVNFFREKQYTSAAIAAKEKSLKHIVSQYIAWPFSEGSKSNLFIENIKTGIRTDPLSKWQELALSADEEQYSGRLEIFLSDIENLTSTALEDAAFDKKTSAILDWKVFEKEAINNGYFKLILSMHLAAQFFRSPRAREKLKRYPSNRDYFDQIAGGIKIGAPLLALRRWNWFYNEKESLHLSQEPLVVYDVVYTPENSPIDLSLFPEYSGIEKLYYKNLYTSSSQIFPFSSHLLLVIDKKNSSEVWVQGLTEESFICNIPLDNVKGILWREEINSPLTYFHLTPLYGKLTAINPTKICKEKKYFIWMEANLREANMQEIKGKIKNAIFYRKPYILEVAPRPFFPTSSLPMIKEAIFIKRNDVRYSSLMFSEYNAVIYKQNDFVYTHKQKIYNAHRWTAPSMKYDFKLSHLNSNLRLRAF